MLSKILLGLFWKKDFQRNFTYTWCIFEVHEVINLLFEQIEFPVWKTWSRNVASGKCRKEYASSNFHKTVRIIESEVPFSSVKRPWANFLLILNFRSVFLNSRCFQIFVKVTLFQRSNFHTIQKYLYRKRMRKKALDPTWSTLRLNLQSHGQSQKVTFILGTIYDEVDVFKAE